MSGSSLADVADAITVWLAASSLQLALFIALVAVAAWSLRKASPRLRYGLWALVLVKAVTPPWLGSPWSLGDWAAEPARNAAPAVAVAIDTAVRPSTLPAPPIVQPEPAPTARDEVPTPARQQASAVSSTWVVAAVWLVGVAGYVTLVAVGYRRLLAAVRRLPVADEGPARVALERAALAIGLSSVERVDLRLADQPTGPFLVGVGRPTIVVPEELVNQLDPEELTGVLAHELMHWRRRDTWIGWAQTLVQAVFWFHPLVWWAGARLRDEREKSCDDAVLRHAASDQTRYGEAIVRSLTVGRGRPIGLAGAGQDNGGFLSGGPLAAAGMVGVFERGAALQQRVEDVMNFDATKKRFGAASAAVLAAFAVAFLPMAGTAQGPDPASDRVLATLSLDDLAEAGALVETDPEVKAEGDASVRITTKWPTTVCLAEVDGPDVENAQLIYSAQVKTELEGMASLEMWAHIDGGTYFSRNPSIAAYGESDWKQLAIPFLFKEGQRPDKVTLNLIVQGSGRVWVDDMQLIERPLPQGFGGGDRTSSARPRERTQPVRKQVAAAKPVTVSPYPQIIETVPQIGATEVNASLNELRVTFDRPMGGGMSWTGDASTPEFPPIDESRKARWIDDRTCVLPVRLQRGSFYRIGINSKSFQNFQSTDGKPAEHAVLAFATAGAKRSVQRRARVPQIVSLDPDNGATDIAWDKKSISVTFNTPMGGGMSWVRTDGRWPGSAGGGATWSKDGRTCTLPVALEPDTSYELSLNGSHYVNFQSRHGVLLPAVVWSFETRE